MSVKRTLLFLFALVYFGTPLRGAVTEITCIYQSSCVLPCPFRPGRDVVIHWLYPPEESTAVHSFYHNSDQLARQKPQYKGRTALFKDQIPEGNASLKLSEVEVADGGRYKCYTSTIIGNNEDYVNVKVLAPVSEVLLKSEGEELTCTSNNIHPRPEVRWTPGPDSHFETSFSKAENGLYSVVSSVSLLNSPPPHEYSCNVSTLYSWKSISYRSEDPVQSESRAVIPCPDTETSIKSLVWTFNLTQNILNRTGGHTDYNNTWTSHVEDFSESGKLYLKDLTQAHQGLYSCELRTDSGTYLSRTEVTVKETAPSALHSDKTTVIVSVLVVIGLIVVAVGVGVFFWCRQKKKKKEQNPNGEKKKKEQNPNGSEDVGKNLIKPNGAPHPEEDST